MIMLILGSTVTPWALEDISALSLILWRQTSMLSIRLLTSATPQTPLEITIHAIDQEPALQTFFLKKLAVDLTQTICPEAPVESTLSKNSTSRLTSMKEMAFSVAILLR